MNHLRLTLALAALAFAPTLAKADPITYTFNQTLTQDASNFFTVTGTVTTDGTLGNITAADITAFDLVVRLANANQTQALELTSPGSGATGNGHLGATADTLSFDFSQGGFVEFGGFGTGNLELENSSESAYVNATPFLHLAVSQSGPQVIATVVPSSVTPEPSSLLLLGTGALGVAGAVRKRIVRA